eukprot:890930-Amphidinium_carterae.1
MECGAIFIERGENLPGSKRFWRVDMQQQKSEDCEVSCGEGIRGCLKRLLARRKQAVVLQHRLPSPAQLRGLVKKPSRENTPKRCQHRCTKRHPQLNPLQRRPDLGCFFARSPPGHILAFPHLLQRGSMT